MNLQVANTIPDGEIKKQSSYDQQGYLFYWNDNIYRAIYPGAEKAILGLFDCGLIDELEKQGLFPRTEKTEFQTSDCSLVLWHETIPAPSLPTEWSFSMLKDAAEAILRVNIIARKYGYQTIDAHGFNILFHRGRPLYVDIGSFIKVENDFNCDKPGWRPYHEFMRFFYGPLKMWGKGESFFARHALHGSQMPMVSYWRHRNPLFRLVPASLLSKFEKYYYKYKALNTVSKKSFLQMATSSKLQKKVASFIQGLANRKMLWFSSVNLERLAKKIDGLKQPKIPSSWANYHDQVELGDRFKTILSKIEEYDISSVLDMAGNAGFLSRRVAELPSIDYVVCADYDENAIDTLYRNLKKEPLDVCPTVLSFSIAISDTKLPSATDRLKCDAVMALALTHHLILTQGLTVNFIFERLKSFSKKYVFVEFMPMGHYSSAHKLTPEVPSWYTLDWYRENFENYFTLLYEQELDINRILLIGEIKEDA